MKKSIIIILVLIFPFILVAQNCGYYIPLKVKSGTEMKSYDANGKLMTTNKNTIMSVTSNGGYTVANIKQESQDELKGQNSSNEYTVKCNGTQVVIDTKSIMGSAAFDNFKKQGYDLKIESIDIEMPSKLTIGSSLKDADVKIKVYQGQNLISDMVISLVNRKVEAIESITTPAGTFKCYKISSESKTSSKIMGYSSESTIKVVDFFAENVGMVKSQTYDIKGKLSGYSVINKIF